MAATTTFAETQSFPWLRDEAPPESGTPHRVALSFEYPVHFTSDVFSWENLTLVRAIARRDSHRRHCMLVVVDRSVADAHPCLLDDVARYGEFHRERLVCSEPVILDGGERAKTVATVDELHRCFHERGLDGDSFVVIVGGGAVQDVVGYAAATAERGPRAIRVPTTLLAQSTAPIVVRSGFHAFRCFAPPAAVIDDFDFLRTLPERETVSGLAEAMRVALSEDASLFGWLRLHASALRACEQGEIRELLRRVVGHHLSRGADPFNARLGLGRWAAHQLELITDHELRYGEAMSIGLALDAVHSAACGAIDTDALEPIIGTLQALGLPTYHPALEVEEVVDGKRRRVVLEGLRREPHLVLEGIGRAREAHEVDHELVLRAIDWLRHRA
jgi:3-dehydroquinate synthase